MNVRAGFAYVFEPIFGNRYRFAIMTQLAALLLALFGLVSDQVFGVMNVAGVFGALAVAFAVQGVLAAPVIWGFHHLGRG